MQSKQPHAEAQEAMNHDLPNDAGDSLVTIQRLVAAQRPIVDADFRDRLLISTAHAAGEALGRRSARRHTWIAGAGGSIATVLVAGLLWMTSEMQSAPLRKLPETGHIAEHQVSLPSELESKNRSDWHWRVKMKAQTPLNAERQCTLTVGDASRFRSGEISYNPPSADSAARMGDTSEKLPPLRVWQ